MSTILGVDVGGTSTDVVLLHGTNVLSSVKRFNTQDVTTGVKLAIGEVLEHCSTVSLSDIARVHIGTTHLVNGLVERKGLAPVAVIRLGGCGERLATDNPPFIDFSSELRKVLYGGHYHAQGGYEFNGVEISSVNRDEINTIVQEIKSNGIRNIVVSGIFSPTNCEQEENVLSLISESYPRASVTLSHTLGQLGLLNRENAGILNETLKPLCAKTINGLCLAMKELNLECPMFLTQNDGTVGTVEKALRFPVMIMASGPTNSMRGAAFLSSCKNALVIDIGGTTSDAGFIERGFPRPSSATMKIAGVSTNFEIPDVFSEGLGGGSKVFFDTEIISGQSEVRVGPDSVGHNLMSESIMYGGTVLSATDVAVAKGICQYGKVELLKSINSKNMELAYIKIKSMLEDIIDRVKTGKDDVKLILVGGGSALFDERDTFKGVSEVIKPKNCQVANAVGAALGQISGCVDKIVEMPERPVNMSEDEKVTYDSKRNKAIDMAKQEAVNSAISGGAKADTVEIISLHEVSLSYIPGNATRIIVKAVGDLDVSASHHLSTEVQYQDSEAIISCSPLPVPSYYPDVNFISNGAPELEKNISSSGEWILSAADIECMCIGAGILGCGGGGNPDLGKLKLLRSLQEGISPKVISLDADLDPDGLVLACGFMGAPLVCIERFSMMESELRDGFYALHDLYNNRGYCDGQLTNIQNLEVKVSDGVTYIENYSLTERGRNNMKENCSLTSGAVKFVCLMSYEIGGSNSTTALLPVNLNLPVVDADAMGRAFPELQMTSLNIYGAKKEPHVLVSMAGQIHVILKAESMKHVEDHLRPLCVAFGCAAAFVSAPISFKEVGRKAVVGTVTQTWELGRALLGAAKAGFTPVQSIIKFTNAALIIEGKICKVDRVTVGGFNHGSFTITGWKHDEGSEVVVDFQNEYLIAKKDSEIVGTTPDLLSLLNAESGYPVSTDELRYGLRVALLLIPAPIELLTQEALAVVAPKAFGYPVEFIPSK